MTGGLCPTTPPMILPPELRPANQRRLDELEKIFCEQVAERASNAAAGSSGAANEDADAATTALDVAAATTAAAPGTADENADEPTRAQDTQTTDTAATPHQIRRIPSRDYV
eukprot:2550821-Pleurochrysis_carterae.AAC.2